ncbi:unnamed protein product [Parnassius apollo]|uniref:(apollo) hypothetical protein n=1 Tax=Parnassius apollo TaxID=110799 RepID=A0A8S3XJQ7_PARAO|nr:unnamed protein product [Parnassius apollo]
MGVEAATGMAIAEVGFSTVEESEKVNKTVFIPVEPVNTEDIIIVPPEVPATDDEDWNTPGCSKDPLITTCKMDDRRQAQIYSWQEENSGDEALNADLENGEQFRVDTLESDSSIIRSRHVAVPGE